MTDRKERARWENAKRFSGWIVTLILLFSTVAVVSYALTPTFTTGPIGPGSFVSESAYVIFTDGSNFFARNGETGAVDFSGSNIATVITDAMAALPTGTGGTLLFKAGNYSFSSGLVINKNGMTFAAETSSAPTDGAVVSSGVIFYKNFNGNFISMNGNTTVVYYPTFRDIAFFTSRSFTGDAIHAATTGTIEIDHSWFRNFAGSAVYLYGAVSPIIRDTLFVNNGGGTIATVRITGSGGHQSTDVTIEHDIFENDQYRSVWIDTNDVARVSGSYFEKADATVVDSLVYTTGLTVIRDNFVIDSTGIGIRIHGTGNTVQGNTVYASDGIGISSDCSSVGHPVNPCVISDNVVIYGGTYGIAPGLGDIVSGNQVYENGRAGIILSNGRNLVSSNTIFDNGQIASVPYGIYVNSGNNTITANTIFDDAAVTATQTVGIFENGPDKTKDFNVVSSNNIWSTASTQKIILYGAHDVAKDNIGFNPVGKITNFVRTTVFDVFAPSGSGSAVVAGKIYNVTVVGMMVTSAGGTGVDITLYDNAGNVIQTGLSTLTEQYVPVGFRIGFGGFSGAPTVTVWGM